MDQTCPVGHKSRRPKARLKTVTLFYIHCEWYQTLAKKYMMYWALARVSFRAAKIVSCNKKINFHGLPSKLL
jgi:hypothetical protein